MATSITVRVPDNLVDQLDELAVTLERSRAYLVKKAMEMYLSEYADYLIAFERLRDKDDDIISSQEMKNLLGISD
ncbi:MAG TPA: ribbon-helix-helix domain-containing protein [Methanoregula sp.]|nr:ribbon-helix-helix domain-containing protein [Methanoregula sp.]